MLRQIRLAKDTPCVPATGPHARRLSVCSNGSRALSSSVQYSWRPTWLQGSTWRRCTVPRVLSRQSTPVVRPLPAASAAAVENCAAVESSSTVFFRASAWICSLFWLSSCTPQCSETCHSLSSSEGPPLAAGSRAQDVGAGKRRQG